MPPPQIISSSSFNLLPSASCYLFQTLTQLLTRSRDLSRMKKKVDPAHMNSILNQGCRPRCTSITLKGRSRSSSQLAYALCCDIYLHIDSGFRRTRQNLGCLPIRMRILKVHIPRNSFVADVELNKGGPTLQSRRNGRNLKCALAFVFSFISKSSNAHTIDFSCLEVGGTA